MKAIAKDPDLDPRRPAPVRPGDEIDLAEYAATSWRYRWVILAAVVVAAVVTYLINRQLTPTYQVTVRLLATESKVVDDATSRAVSVARFRELLESPSLVAALLQEFNLSTAPINLTPQRFLDDNLSVSEIPDTGILQASIRLTDPVTLVKLANAYAARAVDLAERLNQDETVYARDSIKRQADQARTRLGEAERDLETFRKKTQIELLRKDVFSLLEHRPEVVTLQVDIETERAQLRQAEIELGRQERVRDVRRSLDRLPDAPQVAQPAPPPAQPIEAGDPDPAPSPVWTPSTKADASGRKPEPGERQQRPEGAGPERSTGAMPKREPPSAPTAARPPSRDLAIRSELTDPYVNPVYEVLARDVAQARARLAGLERRREQLVRGLNLAAPTSTKLDALYRAETTLAHLTGEYEVARNAYMNAASKHEEARLQITVRSPRLQILDQALPPDSPVAPNIPRNVAAAMMLALTLSVAGVLMFDSSRQRRA